MNHKLIKGPRGGSYWLDDSGKKHYVKSQEGSPRKGRPSVLYKYYCKITKYKDGGYEDDWNEWHEAYNEVEAKSYWQSQYPSNGKIRYDLYIFRKEKA